MEALQLSRRLRPIRGTGFFGVLRGALNGYCHGMLVEKELGQQLRRRNPVIVEEMWKDSAVPMELRRDICDIIRTAEEWPNAHFIPSDLMEYVLRIHWDDLEMNIVFEEIEKKYHIDDLDRHFDRLHELTLEDFLLRIKGIENRPKT